MNKNAIVCILISMFPFALCAVAQTSKTSTPKSAIEQVLHTQQDAWNHHNIEVFMDGYWNSPNLDFSNLRVEMLGPEAAFVRGSWHLTMSDGKTPHGLFTLTFRKFPDGWKIIHDHTSAAD
jgi:beta-aspartyl-peptidase (threonine type)